MLKQLGVIGHPVSHSISPKMQQAAFDALGIKASYSHWETPPEALTEKIASLRSIEILGANVTLPYKKDVVSLVDNCDSLVTRVGAANTVVNKEGHLYAYNTDAPGLISALTNNQEHPFTPFGKKVVVLGTGGAARAAAVALLDAGVKQLTILGRTQNNINQLMEHLSLLIETDNKDILLQSSMPTNPDLGRYLNDADLLLNSTSVGLKQDEANTVIDVALLPRTALVMDMIFNPATTPLLRAAKSHGCHVMNGLSMLLYQGALAFELWTNRTAPIQVMANALGYRLSYR